MLNDVSIGNYYSGVSDIHLMHPLSKIICTFIFILMIFMANSIELAGILIILMIIMMMCTEISFNIYYNVLKNLRFLLLLIFILFSLISLSSIVGFIVLIKSILIIVYLAILTLTTPPTEIVYGLEKFLYPLNKFNIKSNIWALNIGMSLRFIPTVIDEKNNVLKNQISRGTFYKLSFYNYIISIKELFKSCFGLAIRRFKKLKETMVVRLYGYSKTRCNFRINEWGIFDNYILFIHGFMLLMMILRGVII